MYELGDSGSRAGAVASSMAAHSPHLALQRHSPFLNDFAQQEPQFADHDGFIHHSSPMLDGNGFGRQQGHGSPSLQHPSSMSGVIQPSQTTRSSMPSLHHYHSQPALSSSSEMSIHPAATQAELWPGMTMDSDHSNSGLRLHSFSYSGQANGADQDGHYMVDSINGSYSAHLSDVATSLAASTSMPYEVAPSMASNDPYASQPPLHPPQPSSSCLSGLPTFEDAPGPQGKAKRIRRRKSGRPPTPSETDEGSLMIPAGDVPDGVLLYSDFVAELVRHADTAAAEDRPLNWECYLDILDLMTETAKGVSSELKLRRQKKRAVKLGEGEEDKEAVPLEKAYAIRDTVHDTLGILFMCVVPPLLPGSVRR